METDFIVNRGTGDPRQVGFSVAIVPSISGSPAGCDRPSGRRSSLRSAQSWRPVRGRPRRPGPLSALHGTLVGGETDTAVAFRRLELRP